MYVDGCAARASAISAPDRRRSDASCGTHGLRGHRDDVDWNTSSAADRQWCRLMQTGVDSPPTPPNASVLGGSDSAGQSSLGMTIHAIM